MVIGHPQSLKVMIGCVELTESGKEIHRISRNLSNLHTLQLTACPEKWALRDDPLTAFLLGRLIISGESVRFKYERQVGLHPFHGIRLAKAEQVGVTGRIHLHSFAGFHRPHWGRPRPCYHQEFQGSLARLAIPESHPRVVDR